MSHVDDSRLILDGLCDAGVGFVVVGMTAGVMLGAPVVTFDVDILHRRTPENIDRLLGWLLSHGAYHRFDLQNRRLPPRRNQLSGTGPINLQTDLGKLDVLRELSLGEGRRFEPTRAYEESSASQQVGGTRQPTSCV